MTAQPQKFYSEEEYLEMERNADHKSEYYRGEITPINGDRSGISQVNNYNHNRIKKNLAIVIGSFLDGKSCRSYSQDLRVYIPKNDHYVCPDFLIICGENEFINDKKDTILNPTIIIEVLSPSTSGYDRGEKFHLYRSIPSLLEFAIVDSLSIGAEVWRKNEEGIWYLASEAYDIAGVIELGSVNVSLKMTEIYADTEDLITV